jgi:selenocysteine-specific elongation factor
MAPSSLLDVSVEVLASLAAGLKDQARVRFHLGTADVEARVRLLGEEREIPPGGGGHAQIRLSTPLAATAGDHFILRRPSPPLTLGGGRVVDPAPRKHRGRDGAHGRRLAALAAAGPEERLLALLSEAGGRGLGRETLVVRTGLSPEALAREIQGLASSGRVIADESAAGHVLAGDAADAIRQRMTAILGDYHRRHPLDPGMSLQELRRRGAPHTADSLVEALLAGMVKGGKLRLDGKRAASADHRIDLSPAEEDALRETAAAVRAGGFDPPAVDALLAARSIPPARHKALTRLLLDRGLLVRIAEGYHLHAEVLEELKETLLRRREEDPFIDVAWFKQVTGTSRRWAIPLLEYLDAARVTTRRGDRRYIQEPRGRSS